MKKTLIVLAITLLIMGCAKEEPDYETIETLLTQELQVTVKPQGTSAAITIEGFPDTLPLGLEGVSLFVATSDMQGLSYDDLGTPIALGITTDTTITAIGLTEDTKYFYEGRGEVDDTLTTAGFGGWFYPGTDIDAIKELLTEVLQVTVEPQDTSVTITIEGFPSTLPTGLDGVSLFIATYNLHEFPYDKLGEPIASGITTDTVIKQTGLEPTTRYFYEGRGEINDTLTIFGFGGSFETGVCIDYEGIEYLLTQGLLVTILPEDKGVTISLENFPEKLPYGLEGISLFVDTFDMSGVPGDELGTPIASDITEDTVIGHLGLENGTAYFVEGRGEIVGDTLSALGFGGRFYPRPWGQASYYAYDPAITPPEEGADNAFIFDRMTSEPSSETASSNVDFFFFAEVGDLYITNAMALGGTERNGIAAAGISIENWLDVQDAPDIYSDTLMLEIGQVYHFMTADSFYGKFAVDSISPPIWLLAEGDTLRVYLLYAFQTAQYVGHY